MFGDSQAARRLVNGTGSASAAEDSAGLARLREENRLLHAVIDNFPGGIQVFDKDMRLVLMNEQQKQLLQYPPALFEYGPPALEQIYRFNALRGEYGPGDAEEQVAERMRRATRGEPHVFERVRPNGTIIEVRSQPLPGGGLVSTHLDVTAQRRSAAARPAEIATAAAAVPATLHHDPVTSLPDIAVLAAEFERAQARARPGTVMALHYIDLDHFRKAEAVLGPQLTSAFLRVVADRLQKVVRSGDMLARLGEDEFVVLQTEIDRPSSAAKLAHRLVEVVKFPYDVEHYRISIGASVGIALSPRDGVAVPLLIAKARDALDRARAETSETLPVNRPLDLVAGV